MTSHTVAYRLSLVAPLYVEDEALRFAESAPRSLETQIAALGRVLSTLGDFRIGEQVEIVSGACLVDVIDFRDDGSEPIDSGTVHEYIEAIEAMLDLLGSESPDASALADQASKLSDQFGTDPMAAEQLLHGFAHGKLNLSMIAPDGQTIDLRSPVHVEAAEKLWMDVDIAEINRYVLVKTDLGTYAVEPGLVEKLSPGDVVDIETTGPSEMRRYMRADRATTTSAEEPDLFD